MDERPLKQVSKFKYLGSALDESGEVESCRKVLNAIRSLVSDRDSRPECTRVLDEDPLMMLLVYGSETMVWWGEEVEI